MEREERREEGGERREEGGERREEGGERTRVRERQRQTANQACRGEKTPI